MTFPFKFYVAGQPVLLHGVMEMLGIFCAYRYYVWLRKKQGDTVEIQNRYAIVTAAALGAVFGSRLIGALENPAALSSAPSVLVYFLGNKTLVGGLLGGLFGVELVKKIIGEKQKTGNLFTFPLLLGMIIGRIGCFSAGIYEETYGIPSNLPWALNLGDGALRHPVTLYEIVFLACTWIFINFINRKYICHEGALFKMLMIAYLSFRFMLDFIKPGYRFPFGLGTIQISCLCGLFYYYKYLIHPSSLIISKR